MARPQMPPLALSPNTTPPSSPEPNPFKPPYWLMNTTLPSTTPCPAFLEHLSAKDISILSTPNEAYVNLSWHEVQSIIQLNQLDRFQRKPSELRRYLEYNHFIKLKYGSVLRFVVSEKLGWDRRRGEVGEKEVNGLMNGAGDGVDMITARGNLFEFEEDWSVKWNDWPYGLDERIVHLVVWTKFRLEDDPLTNDLTVEARAAIERFVQDVFIEKLGKENVIWFKNWRSLKSVHAVEHFHVMLFNPDPDFVSRITHGDVSISTKV